MGPSLQAGTSTGNRCCRNCAWPCPVHPGLSCTLACLTILKISDFFEHFVRHLGVLETDSRESQDLQSLVPICWFSLRSYAMGHLATTVSIQLITCFYVFIPPFLLLLTSTHVFLVLFYSFFVLSLIFLSQNPSILPYSLTSQHSYAPPAAQDFGDERFWQNTFDKSPSNSDTNKVGDLHF